jgi:NADPH2:quinone reductase
MGWADAVDGKGHLIFLYSFAQHAPYDLVLESVGGQCLAAALSTLAKDGVCVSLGGSASHEVTCDIRQFRQTGRTTLYGFILF